MPNFKKISIIGNGGGGKSTLARQLSKLYSLPLHHVDSIQYLENFKVRKKSETSKILKDLTNQNQWIIDGFGELEIMKDRFLKSDHVIFVDFPLYRHYWWCLKRQISSIYAPRKELPKNCNEASISHTIKLFKILWGVHQELRPTFIEFFHSDEMKNKVSIIHNLKEWNQIYSHGISQ